MSRYNALKAALLARTEPVVTLSFAELDAIIGGLPNSAKTYGAWWANSRSSQPHAWAWLDAGRRASPDFRAHKAVFSLDPSIPTQEDGPAEPAEGQEALAEYVESSISLERDLEDHMVNHLDALEPGLTLVGRQVSTDVGRVDILTKSREGQTVIIELKAGDARDSAIGQVARYIGWYARTDNASPRAILVAGSFSDPVRYAAAAIPALRLVTYQVSFTFSEASLRG
jgi:hypothetical protein